MSAGDRIQRFFDDQAKIIPLEIAQPGKIVSEIESLKAYIVKHQNEALSEGSKSKLMFILQNYNRAAITANAIRNAVISLFQDYLALPEGKLTSSKNKSNVLGWLAHLNVEEERPTTTETKLITERWDVASIENDLLCLVNGDRMHENLRIDNTELFELIKRHYDGEGSCCYVMASFDPNAAQDTLKVFEVSSE